jgi:2,4-dienoyl-CoA reductase-like NADH-dependent reductase (Old Yellow Enzyme family)
MPCEDLAVSEGGEIVQVKRLRDRSSFTEHAQLLGVEVPLAPTDRVADLLAASYQSATLSLTNRLCTLPMEGWDATADGRPTDLVRRRWSRFGSSGAALIWGGEAVAVRADGRANPRQLCIGPQTEGDLAELRTLAAGAAPGAVPHLGLQLTHSGRWSKPNGTVAPIVAYRHPLLDERVGATDADVITDTQLEDLVGDFVRAAAVAHAAGFDFVDVKHCHGYLLHELLSAVDRPGRYGGELENRVRFLDEVVAGIRRDAPGLEIAVRLSAFDLVPYRAGADGRGVPERVGDYPYAFGGDGDGRGFDLTEPHRLCKHLATLGVELVSITAGSPYYCPHAQRPAYFPPSDGYLPPHDPLVDVARLLAVTRELAGAHPSLAIVAGGLSYLQEWFPAAAAALVDAGVASVGYGRGALSYPDLAHAILDDRGLDRSRLCRTFSDCTTAPRNGLVSGCYPLDDFYKQRPERSDLTAAKRAAEGARGGRRGSRRDPR